jgi:Tol biopolymer transport system component
VGDAADYGDIELSPDGRQVAVSVLDSSTNTRDLWIIDVMRGVRTRFTFDKSDDVAPVWSRDGSRVIFTSNRKGHFDLYEKAASGLGVETPVYVDESEKYPTSWLSDAKMLLFWTFSADGTEVRLLGLDGGPPRTFLPSPVSPGRFAPDGRHVLYYSTESGRSEVYLVPFPTATRKWQISNAGGSFPRWRPDGKEVFYIARDNKLQATPVDAGTDRVEIGQPTPLFEARPVGARYSFDVAPGGERFLVNTARVTAVTVVQNWRRLLVP